MASTLMCLTLLVVTGTFMRETSAVALLVLNSLVPGISPSEDDSILDEAMEAFESAKGKVRFNLAPSYGTLDLPSLIRLDESLKVMMGEIFELDLQKQYNWRNLRRALETNPLIVWKPQFSAHRMKRLSFRSLRYFGHNSNKSRRRQKIRRWFSNLIENVDILKDTNIALDKLVRMVSKISVNMLGNLMTYTTKIITLMDQGILRFPDISRPFFTLYRINLQGRCSYLTKIIQQRESCDIFGLFEKQIYYPNEESIKSLSRDSINQILDEVDDLFSDLFRNL